MSETEVAVRFDGGSVADKNKWCEDLRAELASRVPEVSAERTKDSAVTQDFGSTLALVLGTPAALALARGIKSWLERNNSASVSIVNRKGEVLIKNVESKHLAAVVAALTPGQ